MNITTLQKCVEELKKETPNISYVLGMLETVIEMDRSSVPSYPPFQSTGSGTTNVPYIMSQSVGSGLVGELSDEEVTLQKYAGGPLGTIQ